MREAERMRVSQFEIRRRRRCCCPTTKYVRGEEHGQDAVEHLLARAPRRSDVSPGLFGSCQGVLPCSRKMAGGANHGVPVGASLHQLLAVHVSRLPRVRSITLNGPPPPIASLTIASTCAGVASALGDDARRLGDVVAEDVVGREARDVGGDDRHLAELLAACAIMRAPSAASPESTTSIGSARHAGKNGWFTKQRSGCFASFAISRAREAGRGEADEAVGPDDALERRRGCAA